MKPYPRERRARPTDAHQHAEEMDSAPRRSNEDLAIESPCKALSLVPESAFELLSALWYVAAFVSLFITMHEVGHMPPTSLTPWLYIGAPIIVLCGLGRMAAMLSESAALQKFRYSRRCTERLDEYLLRQSGAAHMTEAEFDKVYTSPTSTDYSLRSTVNHVEAPESEEYRE